MSRIEIQYTKYHFNKPDIISQSIFEGLKTDTSNIKKHIKYQFTLFKDYKLNNILFILLLAICLVISLFCKNVSDAFTVIFLFVICFLGSINSLPSMITFQIDKRNYYRKLRNDIIIAKSYREFVHLQKSDGLLKRDDLDMIRYAYSKMTNEELIKLLENKQSLQAAALPLIEQEFSKRGLSTQLENPLSSNPFYRKNNEQIKEIVKHRLENGDNVDVIRLELIQLNIDIIDTLT